MCSAAPWATRRTFAYVKSSAITPRQPSVPNFISGAMSGLKVTGLPGALERLDDLAHVLGPRPRDHQQRVFGVDDDHVLEADRGDESAVTEDETAARVHQDGVALHRVASIVAWTRSPSSDQLPMS